MDGFIRKFQEANILSQGESEELFAWLAQASAVYPRHDPDVVSSHDDLFKPHNILFDGNREEERLSLQDYFGQPPDQYQLARFFLMQHVVHMFNAMAFLLLGSSGKPMNQSEKAPQFNAFHWRMWAGEVNLAEKDTKIVYGGVHWEGLVQNMRQARFNEALTITDRHACA